MYSLSDNILSSVQNHTQAGALQNIAFTYFRNEEKRTVGFIWANESHFCMSILNSFNLGLI